MSDPTYASLVRQIAKENPDTSDYSALSDVMMDVIVGQERELLAKLLPGYMRAVLSRRNVSNSDEEAWEAFLDERLSTNQRGTIFVRDATAEELEAAADRRFKFAGNLDRRGKQYKSVANRMAQEGADKTKDLSRAAGVDVVKELSLQLALEHTMRLRAEGRAKTLASLYRARDSLLLWIERGESPTISYLEQHRDALIKQIQDEEFHFVRSEIYNEVALEWANGTRET